MRYLLTSTENIGTNAPDGAPDMSDTLLPIDDARGPRRAGDPSRKLALAFRDALATSADPEVRLSRRTLRRGVAALPAGWVRVVAWMQPVRDPELGRGWRCTLHAFHRDGSFLRVQEASFEPVQAAHLAVAGLIGRAQ